MNLKKITYYVEGKRKEIYVKKVSIYSSGLMFKKNSPPLLFDQHKNKYLPIISLFCKPFTAIWLDEKMHATQVTDVKKWRWWISGAGKYLLEIPLPLKNNKSPSRKHSSSNRNI
ncbi:hypothetical protein HN604_00705 [archaeon]|jgi:hypothetical protein|nr:hypothetical protein [archaeon]MBT6182317.1 hypothetical protein [archaeon]MBT6606663.1 hypothetical protein [archaeon]MBT7251906.1 hypothetical protein [archaeon]MBT7660586.1 hypothetical protein [archaeon]